DQSQKSFAYRMRQIFLQKLSAFRPLNGGTIPVLEGSKLASPWLLIYLPEDLNPADLLEPISQFLLEQFEPKAPAVQSVKIEAPKAAVNSVTSEHLGEPQVSLDTKPATKSDPEEDIRKEVMSWITL